MWSSVQRKVLPFLSKNCDIKAQFLRRNLSQTKSRASKQIPREKPAVRKPGSTGRGGLPLLIIPIATFGLGTWQIQRRGWKLNLIKELDEKMNTPPVPLPQDLEEIKGMQYKRITVRGTFDHSRELFVGPRSNVQAREAIGMGMSSGPGVNVITPFKLADRDITILVNRGHVTFKYRPPQMRPQGQIEGEVTLTGVVRATDRKPMFDGDPAKDGYWLYTNVEELSEVAETAPVLIDADYKSTVPGGPVGGQTRVHLRNEHLSYIFVWYTLCALSSYMWYRQYRSPMPHKAVLEYVKKNHHKM